jgi:hypothetical protein
MAITINGTGTITGISAGGLPDGSIVAADLAAGVIPAALSNAQDGTGTDFQFNSGYGSVATAYGVRAWVYFNGESGSIGSGLGSGNVSTVTDNGAGDYTVNFTTNMPDANYAVVTGLSDITNNSHAGFVQGPYVTAPSTSAFRFRTVDVNYTAHKDCEYVYLAFIR